MNVIFHTTAALGVAVVLTETNRIGHKPAMREVMPTAISAFVMGIISHGVLDYIPHCYPVNSKVDVIAGSFMIALGIALSQRPYRPIVALAFLGSIFPDAVDLGPKIVNKELNLGMTLPENIFPWHWHSYSGSIYSGDCQVSTLNHFLVVLTVGTVVWLRRTDVKKIFGR